MNSFTISLILRVKVCLLVKGSNTQSVKTQGFLSLEKSCIVGSVGSMFMEVQC